MSASQKIVVLFATVALLVAGCGGNPSGSQIGVSSAPTAPPTALLPTVAPNPTSPATATTQPSPTSAPTAVPAPRVGIQVGHWQLDKLSEEMKGRKGWTGSHAHGYTESEVNLAIGQAVQRQLQAAGVQTDLLPVNLPIRYQADAFVAIHADGVDGAQAATRHGWKLATPYNASPAAEALAAAVEQSYPAVTGMPADPRGPSVEMRAYYAFAFYRYWHAIAPTTPAIIVETGFMTHPADWTMIHGQPELIARGIAEGVLAYLADRYPEDSAARQPASLPMLQPKVDNTPLYQWGGSDSPVAQYLDRTMQLVPLDTRAGWYLVLTRGPWDIGWVRADSVNALTEPLVPLIPRPDK